MTRSFMKTHFKQSGPDGFNSMHFRTHFHSTHNVKKHGEILLPKFGNTLAMKYSCHEHNTLNCGCDLAEKYKYPSKTTKKFLMMSDVVENIEFI